ncbi:hypothetical protein BT96DRAFT_186664 [Gymnopus androsaceus JB14]|uniref:Uncharacterized protein n=1 Tax=Gymnopus androsaceus JB14 TaxID=1447944 RepID=A0A6A4H8R2_9AGAR|nr:hypothetical protein BT96DRAFT_186664 [Gymnopus androsaceus JB14]
MPSPTPYNVTINSQTANLVYEPYKDGDSSGGWNLTYTLIPDGYRSRNNCKRNLVSSYNVPWSKHGPYFHRDRYLSVWKRVCWFIQRLCRWWSCDTRCKRRTARRATRCCYEPQLWKSYCNARFNWDERGGFSIRRCNYWYFRVAHQN